MPVPPPSLPLKHFPDIASSSSKDPLRRRPPTPLEGRRGQHLRVGFSARALREVRWTRRTSRRIPSVDRRANQIPRSETTRRALVPMWIIRAYDKHTDELQSELRI